MKAKELREYKARMYEHETAIDVSPCYTVNGFTGYESAYLDDDAKKELRQAVNARIADGGIALPNSNKKASIRKGDGGEIILTSYYTDVAMFKGETFCKLWQGFSVTTLNHVNEFRKMFNRAALSKYDWIMLETGKETTL